MVTRCSHTVTPEEQSSDNTTAAALAARPEHSNNASANLMTTMEVFVHEDRRHRVQCYSAIVPLGAGLYM